jgi:hypothetical protein
MKKDFLNEKITIREKGTIPLIYNGFTDKSINKPGITITLDLIYKNITSVGAEYITVTKKEPGFMT